MVRTGFIPKPLKGFGIERRRLQEILDGRFRSLRLKHIQLKWSNNFRLVPGAGLEPTAQLSLTQKSSKRERKTLDNQEMRRFYCSHFKLETRLSSSVAEFKLAVLPRV